MYLSEKMLMLLKFTESFTKYFLNICVYIE